MSWSVRRAVGLGGSLLVLGLLAALPMTRAQDDVPVRKRPPIRPPVDVPPMGKPRTNESLEMGFDLPTEDGLKGKLEDINVFLKSAAEGRPEDWPQAVERLQGLMERSDDLFTTVKRPSGGGLTVNVKREAQRLISELPKPGMDHYRLVYGPKAAEELKNAKITGEEKAFAQIMDRYLYTDAGIEATELLATQMLDRAKYSQAALCFQRLFQRVGPPKLEPLTLLKSAIAFHHVGDNHNLKLAWDTLETKGDTVTVGEKKIALADLKAFVAKRKTMGLNRERHDWIVVGGDASRSAKGNGGTAFLEPRWKFDTVSEPTAKGMLATAVQYLEQNRLPILHGFAPLAATVTTAEGAKIPLMIYRSHMGLQARAVKAVPKEELKAGDVFWASESPWSLEKMLRDPASLNQLNFWTQQYVTPNRVRPQIIFENSVIGSMSTDNVRLYAIDDFQVTPTAQQVGVGGRPGGQGGGKLADALNHNRLQAIDLDSGKLLWEIGHTGRKDDISDSFFLGAPLPLNGRLYVLNERDQELRLLIIDPATGKLLQDKPQRLADMREKIQTETQRRFNVSHLAYGEGMLICPTNSGGILAIDLLTNSIAWAYGYYDAKVAEGQPFQPGMPVVGPGMVQLPDGRIVPKVQLTANGWRATPPVITEGKVIFSSPDASAVHCVNLRDGTKLWKSTRKDGDLYLAGVYDGKALIIGKSYARLINVADGSDAATLETGMPSGFGVASKDIYYLPLALDVKTREPGICLIDFKNDRVHARTRSRERLAMGKPTREIPGNLLFYEGEVLSQSLTDVASYPQLEVELKVIDTLLAQNERDPEGRVRRGDLRLDRGDLAGAIEDLRTALASAKELRAQSKPVPDGLEDRAKTKLFETLTEFFQRNFNDAEKYLAEYETMCEVVKPGLDGEALKAAQAEEKRRKGNFYCLVGRGREKQKKIKEAFEAYMNFGALGTVDNEMMSVVDDPGVKASPMVWAQGRIAAMVANAGREELKPLEELVSERWKKVQQDLAKDKAIEPLRNFVSTFGSISSVGREARLVLAERLIQDGDKKNLVDAERHLSILRMQKDDQAMAARAVETLARLMTSVELMEDAAHFYRLLGRDYAKVQVRDGKTGQDIYNELATDKRFLPFLDEVPMAFSGKIKAEENNGSFPYPGDLHQLEQVGEALPYFTQKYQLAIRTGFNQLKLIDRDATEDAKREVWSVGLTETSFHQYSQINDFRQHTVRPRFTYQNLGHLVMVQVGHRLFALDPVNQKVLWEKHLSASPGVKPIRQPPQGSLIVDPRDGSTWVIYHDGWAQRLGKSGRLSPTAVPVMTQEALHGVDPISGQVLWTRNDMPKAAHLYSDDQHIYTIEMGPDGTTGSTRVFRLHDGVTVPTRDFSDLYAKRLKISGNLILAQGEEGRGVSLRLYDILTGTDRYKGTFAPNSFFLEPECDDLAGVVEPNGKVTIVDLKAAKVLFTTEMKVAHLGKIKTMHLLRDSKDIFIVCNNQLDQQVEPTSYTANFMPQSGLKGLGANGMIYSFDGKTGELNWYNNVENQVLLLDEFERIPVVILTSRYRQWQGGMRVAQENLTVMQSYDKKTGKLLFTRVDRNQGQIQQFHSVKLDARAGRIDLLTYNLAWTHRLDTAPGGAPNMPQGGGARGGVPDDRAPIGPGGLQPLPGGGFGGGKIRGGIRGGIEQPIVPIPDVQPPAEIIKRRRLIED